MPRAALSPAEIDAFRKKAIRAATRLFAEHGYDGVTMRAIADKIGVSPMAPYRYFENKEEIFAMVRAEGVRRLTETQEAASKSTDDPIERLVRMRDAYVRFAIKNPDEYRVIFELRQAPELNYPKLAEESRRSFALNEDAVGKAIEAGVMQGDPTTVAHLLWATVHGIVALHLAGKLVLGRSLEDLLDFTGARFRGAAKR